MKTEAIIGPQKSSEAVIVSKIGNKSQVPVISFSATSPTLSSMHVPYFIRTTIDDAAQVQAITALIKAYGWREVVPIYEDTEFGWGIIPFLSDALEEINVRLPYRSLIKESSTDDQVQKELYKLQTMQTRVFVVHMTPSKGSILFLKAKQLGMMEEGYVWIMTNALTNVIYCFNRSVVSAMNGALGVQLYVPNTEKLENFATRWRKEFQKEHPKDEPCDISIYALLAYDTIHALAMSVEKVGSQSTKPIKNSTGCVHLPIFSHGPQLQKAISSINFDGLSGKFELRDGQLQYSRLEIINVVGYGIRSIGYWSAQQGVTRRVDANYNKTNYLTSEPDLNPVIWPGESIVVPKGWEIPVSGKKLRVGVKMTPTPEFMNVEIDHVTNAIIARGYAIDVFEEAIKRLPYAIPYEYELFGDPSGNSSLLLSYDDFVYQVYLGNYDVVIGDITIRYNRTRYADFSVSYTESGVGMIVPVKEARNKNSLIFLKPLDLWLGSFVFFIYTGIAIFILEPKMRTSVRGSLSKHLQTIVHLSLFAYKEKLESSLSKIVGMVWVFVLLVLTSSYTASLSSMLTVQQLQPTATDIHDLINKGEYIGYKEGSFMEGLLLQLGCNKAKMRGYIYPEEFAEALDKGSGKGGVAAIIHSLPYIKLFLAKYCNSYTMVGPIYKTAGFGFAFPKGSPLVPDMSHAILNITDGDDIIRIEKKWIGGNNCKNTGSVIVESNSLSFYSFWGLFLMSGMVTTISLLIFAITSFYKKRQNMTRITSIETSSNETNDNETMPT